MDQLLERLIPRNCIDQQQIRVQALQLQRLDRSSLLQQNADSLIPQGSAHFVAQILVGDSDTYREWVPLTHRPSTFCYTASEDFREYYFQEKIVNEVLVLPSGA